MFCPECGNQLDPNATNCIKCGHTFAQPNNLGNTTTEFMASSQVQSQQSNQ